MRRGGQCLRNSAGRGSISAAANAARTDSSAERFDQRNQFLGAKSSGAGCRSGTRGRRRVGPQRNLLVEAVGAISIERHGQRCHRCQLSRRRTCRRSLPPTVLLPRDRPWCRPRSRCRRRVRSVPWVLGAGPTIEPIGRSGDSPTSSARPSGRTRRSLVRWRASTWQCCVWGAGHGRGLWRCVRDRPSHLVDLHDEGQSEALVASHAGGDKLVSSQIIEHVRLHESDLDHGDPDAVPANSLRNDLEKDERPALDAE